MRAGKSGTFHILSHHFCLLFGNKYTNMAYFFYQMLEIELFYV